MQGNDQRGTVQLRAEAPVLDWPRMFRAPDRAATRDRPTSRWRREGDAWVLARADAELDYAQAKARADLEFRYLRGDVSPVLNMTATIEDIDVTIVPQFLPVGRMNERTIAWLDGAFKHGRATNGKLSYRGPVRKFPFRQGEGEFTATVDAQDMTLDYYPGFAPLTEAAGSAEFHNASIGAKLTSGQDRRAASSRRPISRISDYKIPGARHRRRRQRRPRSRARYVQASPLGPRLGDGSSWASSGSGPARYDVALAAADHGARTVQPPAGTPRKNGLSRAGRRWIP